MPNLEAHKVTALPGALQPHSIYFVAPAARPNYVEVYVTNAAGDAARKISERNALLQAALPGDCIHVIDPFCLGLSEADARWFMEQAVGAGVRISVAGASVDRLDQIKAIASEAGRKQNRQHVRASRGYVDPEAELPAKKSRRKWPAGPCVYRLFDADGRLLYVGCTKLYRSRRQQHRSKADFRAEIASEQVESYPTMREALDAERLAIWDEWPIYNQRRHKPKSR